MTTTPRPTPETEKAFADRDHFFAKIVLLEQERDKARGQLEAMRTAIKEVYNSFADEPASDSAWLLDDRQTAALTNLQPFLKP